MIDTTFIRRFQDAITGKLLSEPLLNYVSIVSHRFQVTQAIAQRIIPHLAGRNGKVGAGVLVNLPAADPSKDADVPGAQMDALIWLDILSKDDINLVATNGANITAEEILVIIWFLLNQWLNQGIGSGNMYVDGFDPIEDRKGAYGYRIQIRLRLAEDQPAKVAAPTISFAGDNASLACATNGAVIFYTTDGSLPGPWLANPGDTPNTSQPYNAPVAVPSGATILAAAYIGAFVNGVWQGNPAYIGSDVWSATAP